jgi:chitodextrinase
LLLRSARGEETNVTMQRLAFRSTCLVAILFGLVLGSSTRAAAQQSAAAPKNLRVTGVTDWTVTLSWDAAKGKAPASYVVQGSHGHSINVAGSQTTAVFSKGFDYNRTYSFRVYAVNASGGWSSASNSVTATLLADTAPPPTPEVSSTGIGPTHIDLAWSYPDNDPSPRFDIYVNAQLWHGQVAGTAKRIVFLSPNTTYTFTVRARDSGGNWSEMSDPFVATTPAAANEHEPPTTPPSF